MTSMKDEVVKEEIRTCLLAAFTVQYMDASFHSSLCLAKSHVDNVFQCKVLFVLLNEAMISINSVNEDSFLHIATHQ